MIITSNNITDIYKCKKANHDIMIQKGYTEIDTLFCDSSGLGADNELALTKNQLEEKLTQLTKEHGKLHAFITNIGQFQVYITLYKKTNKSNLTKIALNTYKIKTANGYKIQYYNTVIIEKDGNKTILKNGGYTTKTTKDRINKEIQPNHYIMQKNYVWYVVNSKNGQKVEFFDGIILQ
jgi:hypothetical protein